MSEGIVYQNKDVEFKMISETFKEKSFAAYGLDLPKIKAVLPTNLPAVFANEMRIYNVFLLEDDSVEWKCQYHFLGHVSVGDIWQGQALPVISSTPNTI